MQATTRRQPATSVTDLGTAELFALATARLWVARCLNPDRPTPDWDGGFGAAGLEPCAAGAFDSLFRAIAAGARRDMEFHCPSCPCLAADERQYLHMLALFQQGFSLEAAAILEDWLSPAAFRAALEPAGRFAAALAWAGLGLPLRAPGTDDHAKSVCERHSARGTALLH